MSDVAAWLISLLISWVIAAVLLVITDRLHIGLKVASFGTALLAALVIAMWSLVTLPILRFLQVPFEGVGLGLIAWAIGWVFAAFILYLTAKFMKGFTILNFPAALVVALVLGILSWLADWLRGLF